MKLQRPRNSNSPRPEYAVTRHVGAIHFPKPPPELLKMKTASSEKEGKKLEGFQLLRGILSKQ
jgi:hypothetical protein